MSKRTPDKAKYWSQALAVDAIRLHGALNKRFNQKLIREYLVYFKDSIKNLEGVLDE